MSIEKLLQNYPHEVSDLIALGRNFLLESVTGLQEELDLPSKILVYRIADGMRGIVFTLIPSKKGVKLGVFRGRELDDPAHLMEGRGKVHTTIPLGEALLSNPDFHALLSLAVAKARARVGAKR